MYKIYNIFKKGYKNKKKNYNTIMQIAAISCLLVALSWKIRTCTATVCCGPVDNVPGVRWYINIICLQPETYCRLNREDIKMTLSADLCSTRIRSSCCTRQTFCILLNHPCGHWRRRRQIPKYHHLYEKKNTVQKKKKKNCYYLNGQWQSLYFGFRITVTWVDVAKTWSGKK